MKKVLKSILVMSALSLVLAACSSKEGSKEKKEAELIVSTWGFWEDFFRENVYAPFEKEHNVKSFSTQGTMQIV